MRITSIPPDRPDKWRTAIADVDLVLTGVPDSEAGWEERNGPVREAVRSNTASQVLITTGMLGDDGKDRFDIAECTDIDADQLGKGKSIGTPSWNELSTFVATHFKGKRLLVDLTTLSGSAVFQFVAAFHKAHMKDVAYCYTAPNKYPQVDDPEAYPPLVTRTIKQPHGYRSFAQEFDSGSRVHIVLLGFDRHRPNKFIEHYQWPLNEVRAVLGEPAYVDGGELQATLSLGKIYTDLIAGNSVFKVDPKDPADVVRILGDIAKGYSVVDIVPLGPKPVLLGTALYWLSLDADSQERTRILYDFPRLRKRRTSGIGMSWIYKSTGSR